MGDDEAEFARWVLRFSDTERGGVNMSTINLDGTLSLSLGQLALVSSQTAEDQTDEAVAETELLEATEVVPAVTEGEETAEGEDEVQEETGVLRHIREGHFKGVADLRLRINFQAELEALERQEQEAAVQETAETVVQTAQETAETLVATENVTEEQAAAVEEIVDGFSEEVTEITEATLAAEEISAEEFGNQIQTAFDAFSSALAEALSRSPEPVEGGDEVQLTAEVVEAEESEQTDSLLETMIDDLGGALTASLEALVAEFEAMQLPEVSGPQGNGKAYGKFLEMYQEISGANAETEPEGNEPLETVA
jgi:hypothetical protein